jgi:hypothetical protein
MRPQTPRRIVSPPSARRLTVLPHLKKESSYTTVMYIMARTS